MEPFFVWEYCASTYDDVSFGFVGFWVKGGTSIKEIIRHLDEENDRLGSLEKSARRAKSERSKLSSLIKKAQKYLYTHLYLLYIAPR